MASLADRLNWARTLAVAWTGWTVDRLSALIHRPDPEDAVWLSSTPRAGSTWLMSLLEELEGYRSVFEPLHPAWYRGVRDLDLPNRPSRATAGSLDDLEAYVERVLTGRQAGAYRLTRLVPTLPGRFVNGNLVLKTVRFNRLLGWLESSFQLRGTVLLLRHPCATVESQLRTNVHGYPSHRETFPPPALVQDEALAALDEVPADLEEDIRSLEEPHELMALSWAVDTLIPLTEPHPDRTTVFFEDLVLDGPNQLERIFAALGTEVPEGAAEQLEAPSRTSTKPETDDARYLKRWEGGLTDAQADRILEIASWFDLDEIYTDEPVPREDGLERFRETVNLSGA